MPPQLALLLGAIFVFFAFRSDRKRNVGETKGLFWPTLWYLVVSSRPVGYWLGLWGVPIPGASNDPTDGSVIDRTFFALLTVIGLSVLSRRGFKWGAALRLNPWLTAFVVYMAISIIWSQYPYVSFKRYIKVIGSIVMAMVVLTNGRPLDSIFTVLRRCLYIHLPMSIICIKYFRFMGVSFEWDGHVEFWNGIATSKNTLGQVSMLAVLYFSWEVRRHWQDYGWRNIHILYLMMAIYLIKGSDAAISMTSVSVCLFALAVLFRIQSLRFRPATARRFVLIVFSCTVAFVAFVLVHSVVMFSADSFFGHVISIFGRDITLTDRTSIWSDVYAATSGNPLLGVGFGGFWIGRMANIPWNASMTWVLGQAHSGYVDTYLQLGAVGAFLLAGVIFTTMPRMLDSLADDFDFACFRITLFLTILFINVTESVYLRGDHHLWFLLQVILWTAPITRSSKPVVSVSKENVSSDIVQPPALPTPFGIAQRLDSIL